jgi:hypothetical protein
MGVSGERHFPAALYPQERTPGTHWTGGWVGPRAGLDTEASGKTICLCRRSNPGRPICSQTLHWLRYGVWKLEHQLESGTFPLPRTEHRPSSSLHRSYVFLNVNKGWLKQVSKALPCVTRNQMVCLLKSDEEVKGWMLAVSKVTDRVASSKLADVMTPDWTQLFQQEQRTN